MAIFEKEEKKNSYIGLLDAEGELIAFVSPVKGITNELLVKALTEKGLKAEVRESKADRVSLAL